MRPKSCSHLSSVVSSRRSLIALDSSFILKELRRERLQRKCQSSDSMPATSYISGKSPRWPSCRHSRRLTGRSIHNPKRDRTSLYCFSAWIGPEHLNIPRCGQAGARGKVSRRQSSLQIYWERLILRKPPQAKSSTTNCACTGISRRYPQMRAASQSIRRVTRIMKVDNFSRSP